MNYGIKRFLIYFNLNGFEYKNKASQAIQSPRTVSFFLLVSLLDRYSFANVLVKGIVAFKHKKNCDLDINHRPLKHEPIKDMFILSICVKLC